MSATIITKSLYLLNCGLVVVSNSLIFALIRRALIKLAVNGMSNLRFKDSLNYTCVGILASRVVPGDSPPLAYLQKSLVLLRATLSTYYKGVYLP